MSHSSCVVQAPAPELLSLLELIMLDFESKNHDLWIYFCISEGAASDMYGLQNALWVGLVVEDC